MPLYEYQCKSCEHTFEKIVKFSDPPITECPACGEDAVEQLLSAPAVQFKGSGWYVTDYAKKNSSKGSSNPAAGSGSASESKSESKTEKSDSSKPSEPAKK